MSHASHIVKTLVLAFFCTLTSLTWALPSDKDQPIQLKADMAEIDDKNKVSVYVGNVFVKQGSLEITADKITVYSDENGVKEMIAVGKPVYFEQQSKVDAPLTKGYGLTMEYYVDQDLTILIEEAKLTQAGDIFTGDRIEYEMDVDVVTATSEKPGSQVEMILPPRNSNP